MKTGGMKSLPQFDRPSAKVRGACTIVYKALLAHGLRQHFAPETPFIPSASYQEAQETVLAEEQKRLTALFEHYSIAPNSPGADYTLAYHVACDFIPNFCIFAVPTRTDNRGRKPSVAETHVGLVGEILRLHDEKGMKIIEACRTLSRTKGEWKGVRPKLLQSRYYRFAEYAMRRERTRVPLSAIEPG
jgi:hypothetical protein